MSSILEYYVTAEDIAQLEASEDAYDRGCTEGEARGRAEGEARGRVEGEASGEARGRAEGEARGRAEGEASGIKKLVKRLCKMGTALDVAIQAAAEDFDKSINEVKQIMEGVEI